MRLRQPPLIERRDVPSDFFRHYPGMTQCACCDALVLLAEAVTVTHDITETSQEHEHFCSTTCATQQWEAFHAYD